MIITRHNYEEFFLMYVDNELTAEERAAVELFVQRNPDIAPELDMLLQTKLSTDDTLVFDDKRTLLQNVNAIGIDNYEEQFLLYIDNELNKEQKEDVEKFVLQHPQFQDEFTLLKQTVLEPEAIVFEDKASLLRKEGRRVVPMFIRMAAAAAVIGVAVIVWWPKNNTTTSITGVTAQTKDTLKDNTASVDIQDQQKVLPEVAVTPEQQTKEETIASVSSAKEKKEKETVSKSVQKNALPKDVVAVNSEPKVDKVDKTVAAIKPDAHDKEDINIAIVPPNNNTSDNPIVAGNIQHDNDNGVRFAGNADGNNSNNTIVQHAVYKVLDTEEEDNRNDLYVGSLQINKNKVRGIVKKVGGLFAGRSKDGAKEDGKLQIANLELNTN